VQTSQVFLKWLFIAHTFTKSVSFYSFNWVLKSSTLRNDLGSIIPSEQSVSAFFVILNILLNIFESTLVATVVFFGRSSFEVGANLTGFWWKIWRD
jgi:hypothetical protein